MCNDVAVHNTTQQNDSMVEYKYNQKKEVIL